MDICKVRPAESFLRTLLSRLKVKGLRKQDKRITAVQVWQSIIKLKVPDNYVLKTYMYNVNNHSISILFEFYSAFEIQCAEVNTKKCIAILLRTVHSVNVFTPN